MLSVQPSIDTGIARIAPQFRALSMLVEAAPLVHPQVGEAALTRMRWRGDGGRPGLGAGASGCLERGV
jgi:hypothetical protein